MMRGPFRRGAGEPTRGASAAEPAGLSAFIDQGSEFEGKLSFKDTVRIDGRFRGEISSENTLVVGEPGEIEATVRSRTVIVSGSVVGSVFASEQLVLHKGARIEGEIEAPSLVVEEGARINGRVTMKPAASTSSPSAEGSRGNAAAAHSQSQAGTRPSGEAH